MKIILENLSPKSCDEVCLLYPWENIEIEAQSFGLSAYKNDTLKNKKIDIKQFLLEYLKGGKATSCIKSLKNSNLNDLDCIEQLDLTYRLETNKLESLFSTLDLNIILRSKRAFIIAYKCKFNEIVDIFLERNSLEWFYSISEVVPSVKEILNITQSKTLAISTEYSAKKINSHYYIHKGTNNWNKVWLKSTKWNHKWEEQLKVWQNHFKNANKRIRSIAKENYINLVVPEKDTIARLENNDFQNENHLPFVFVSNVAKLIDKNKFLFPLLELLRLNNKVRYKTPDSHLSAEDYWTILLCILENWGLKSLITNVDFSYSFEPNYGDLGSKFNEKTGQRQVINFCHKGFNSPIVSKGLFEFQSPLRESYVKWENTSPLINKKILILGDSHCSIGGNPFLTYLFACIFSEVSFYWNPYFLHNLSLPENEEYDFVLSEISQRFITPLL